jgi:hypothetical protein
MMRFWLLLLSIGVRLQEKNYEIPAPHLQPIIMEWAVSILGAVSYFEIKL